MVKDRGDGIGDHLKEGNEMNTTSKQPRKQHRMRANSPLHTRNKELRVPLDSRRYGSSGVRRVTARKGDTVRIVRGSRSGLEGKIAKVDLQRRKVSIEKALIMKADNKEVPLWFDPSNLVITKLDLSDPARKERFKGLAEE